MPKAPKGSGVDKYPGLKEFATRVFQQTPPAQHDSLRRELNHFVNRANKSGAGTQINWTTQTLPKLRARFGALNSAAPNPGFKGAPDKKSGTANIVPRAAQPSNNDQAPSINTGKQKKAGMITASGLPVQRGVPPPQHGPKQGDKTPSSESMIAQTRSSTQSHQRNQTKQMAGQIFQNPPDGGRSPAAQKQPPTQIRQRPPNSAGKSQAAKKQPNQTGKKSPSAKNSGAAQKQLTNQARKKPPTPESASQPANQQSPNQVRQKQPIAKGSAQAATTQPSNQKKQKQPTTKGGPQAAQKQSASQKVQASKKQVSTPPKQKAQAPKNQSSGQSNQKVQRSKKQAARRTNQKTSEVGEAKQVPPQNAPKRKRTRTRRPKKVNGVPSRSDDKNGNITLPDNDVTLPDNVVSPGSLTSPGNSLILPDSDVDPRDNVYTPGCVTSPENSLNLPDSDVDPRDNVYTPGCVTSPDNSLNLPDSDIDSRDNVYTPGCVTSPDNSLNPPDSAVDLIPQERVEIESITTSLDPVSPSVTLERPFDTIAGEKAEAVGAKRPYDSSAQKEPQAAATKKRITPATIAEQRRARFEAPSSSDSPYMELHAGEPIVGTSQKIEKSYFRLTGQVNASVVRPPEVIEYALHFVYNKYMSDRSQYSYILDQLKSMRQDLTVQHVVSPLTVRVYEYNARVAVEHDDMSEFNQCATQLFALYSHARTSKTKQQAFQMLENEQEFQAYMIYYKIYVEAWEELGVLLRYMELHPRKVQKIPGTSWPRVSSLMLLHARECAEAVMTHNYPGLFLVWRSLSEREHILVGKFAVREQLRALEAIVRATAPQNQALPLLFVGRLVGLTEIEEVCAFMDTWGVPHDGTHIVSADALSAVVRAASTVCGPADLKGQV